MKQFITSLALIFSYMLCGAQATTLVVDNQTPGWLSSKIGYGDQQTVEDLTVIGYLNAEDLKFIGTLINNHNLHGYLNLEDCQIVDKNGTLTNNLESNCFAISYSTVNSVIEKISLPISLASASNCLNSSYITIDTLVVGGPNMKLLGKSFFSSVRGSNDNIRHLIIRDGVEEIEQYAFYTRNNYSRDYDKAVASDVIQKEMPILESVYLPESMKKIGNSAFDWCINLKKVNLANSIHSIGNLAFTMTGIRPDTLFLPESLVRYYTNSFDLITGQTIVLEKNVEIFDNRSWLLTKSTNVSYVINQLVPPRFLKGEHDDWYQPSYSDGKELSGCTLYVPKGGYSMYADPKYNSVGDGGTWSGWTNPYSHANIKTIHIPVEEITLNHSSTSLNVGNSIDLVASVLPTDADNQSISWSTSNLNVASVSTSGVVTALSCGNAVISAYSSENSNIYATCEITVRQPLQTITLNAKNITLTAGQTYDDLSLTYYPATADNKDVTWQSSNTDVVTVDIQGKITAISGGESKITVCSVENSNIKDECMVTVLQPTTGIYLDKSEIEITEDESIQLIATVLPENASNKKVNWSSSDVSVAMVSPDGTVYAIKAGQATIMASTVDGGFVALCKVTVKAKTIQISNIELSSNTESIAVGETLQLNAIISPDNASNKTVNWTSTNPSIASVNATGLATAIAEGKTQIIATTTDGSNLSAICEITVNKQFISVCQIQITPSNARITVGQTLNLSAAIAPDDATNKAIKWSSTNPAIATVSESGVVSAISDGNVIIIASTQDGSNLSATCQVEVYTETILVETINLNPTKIEGAINDTYEIEAIVLPTNATNKNLTWKSSDESIVTVDNGVITLHARGTAIITAEAMDGSNVKSECTIIVSHEAGIDSIIADKESYVKVFNLSGYLIYEGIYSEAKLAPGFYIVLCNGASYKTKVD
ncbi:MAG: Ig-like domain-containing protein [Muribaculaceae bacterium]|nr:Ig-like domain-containing protein [Muribaculaceae bacterium]